MDPMAEKYYSISPYAYCAGNPMNLVDPNGKEGVKYTDENGRKVIESNVVVLLEKEVDITEEMNERSRARAERKNRRIRQRNERRINQVKETLNSFFGVQENSNGEKVSFVFNVIGAPVDNPEKTSMKEIRSLAVANGIAAQTPDRINTYGSGVALAAVLSQANVIPSSLRGNVIGGILITLNYLTLTQAELQSTFAHEMGHTLKLTHPRGGSSSGLMCYPPEGLSAEEVDLIWEKAYYK